MLRSRRSCSDCGPSGRSGDSTGESSIATGCSNRPATPRSPEFDDDTIAKGLWVRIERETLRRFPIHDTVLFTLRTYLRPLRWFADDARRLAEALRTMPPEIAAYKDATVNGPIVAAWLKRVGAAPSPA